VFGGEDVGIGRGEERCGFVVGLVGPLSRGSGFSGGDCGKKSARFWSMSMGISRCRGRAHRFFRCLRLDTKTFVERFRQRR